MKLFKKPLFFLFVIIFIAAILRLYDLGKVPHSLNWDEVSLGYNAYSILKTGHDEYGAFMPVVLRSFDDYKPALYTYFTIPFIGILGLTEFAVRLPSAFAGISAVAIVYFLVTELLGNKKIKLLDREIDVSLIALLTSFFLAISPWHIQFSRIAFESNVGLTLNLLAFFLFLKGLKRNYLLPVAFFVAALNIHMYQSERVFSPLLMIALSIIFYKKLFKIKRWFLLSLLTAIIVALPLVVYILNDSRALMRAKGVSVFSEQTLVKRSAIKLLENKKTGNIVGKAFDNRRVDFVKATVGGYISHFDLNWLFITGDIARHHAPSMGLLYIFQFPFLFVGIYLLVFLKIDLRYKIAFFTYFLLVPVPASITSGVPHAVRTLNFAWTWELFIALGVAAVGVFVLKQKKAFIKNSLRVVALFYILFALFNFAYYINQYFVQMNYFTAKDWLFGYKEAIAYISPIKDQYDKIIVENEVPFDQSYMFFLFYLKVDPYYYQKLGGTDSGGFKEEHRGFYNFVFKSTRSASGGKKTLVVGRPGDISGNSSNVKVIYYPDGTPAIAVGEK
ncbi:MAG: hypothetical protein Q7T54_03070 [Candidatus Levybacteria bacterium]|nr:hypothetical protein [Candidatus Levybacteria bacterium]